MSNSKVILDTQVIHTDDIGEIVGEFYGTPVRSWNANATLAREDANIFRRIAYAKEVANALSVSQ